MADGPGCLVDAGIIDDKCKLTPKAKKKFIQAVKDELTFGTNNLPVPLLFPCGDPVPPNPFAAQLDLENEAKFPDFHKNILGAYEKIACSLNLKSDFKLLPICDPVALGAKLNVKIKVSFPKGFIPYTIPNPPLLAVKLKVMPPPKLVAKFPSIPSVPPPLPKFEVPPNIKAPDFSTLFDFSLAYSIGIPKLLVNLVGQMPKLALKLPVLPELFKAVCELAFSSNVFGNIKPESIVQIVATKVLTTKVVEMVFIAAVGTTMGSASGGITGGIGRFLGYSPEEDEEEEPPLTPRDQIVSYALELEDTGYGQGEEKQDIYASHLLPVEYPEPAKGPQADLRAIGKAKTLAILKEASSCGLVARACLANGGASYVMNSKVDTSKQDPSVNLYYDFFLDRYKIGSAIAGIYYAAKAKNAIIPYKTGDLPALKRGDIIIVEVRGTPGKEHVIVLVEDYIPGTLMMTTIEGGQPDSGNGNKPTAVKKKTYSNSKTVPKGSGNYSMYLGSNNEVIIAGRTVLALIDGEKLCTDSTGSDMSKPNGELNTQVANDGPGSGFQEEDSTT